MHIVSHNDISLCDNQSCVFLFYFTASWCGPCQRIKPMIQALSDGFDKEKLQICMIDIDTNDTLSETYDIRSVPTFCAIHNGELKGSCSGADINQVHALLKQVL